MLRDDIYARIAVRQMSGLLFNIQQLRLCLVSGLAMSLFLETHIEVQLNNRQVSVHFLVADIADDEALLGHLFLTQAHAHLDLGTTASNCLVKRCHISSLKGK